LQHEIPFSGTCLAALAVVMSQLPRFVGISWLVTCHTTAPLSFMDISQHDRLASVSIKGFVRNRCVSPSHYDFKLQWHLYETEPGHNRNLFLTKNVYCLQRSGVPRSETSSTSIKWNLPGTENVSVPCGSVIGRIHCTNTYSVLIVEFSFPTHCVGVI
jgi:hypothetical protein